MDRLRTWLAALVLALPPLAIAGSWAMLAPRLPPTVATHWSSTDVADGFSSTVPTALTLLAVTTAILLVGLALAVVRIAAGTRATVLSLLAAVSGVLAAAWIVSAVTTAEAGSAEGARLEWWWLLIAGAAALMLVPWFVHPRDEPASLRPAEPIPLTPTDAASWRGEASATVFLWLGIAMAVGAVALMLVLPIADSAAIGIAAGVILLAAAGFLVALSRIRVQVDGEGMRVRSALFGIPLRTVPSEHIRVVEAMQIAPLEWGGWGYRGTPGRLAIVLRAGPGIVVTTRDGSRFAVTVDDAQTGASTLAAIVERQREQEAPARRSLPGGEPSR
ncbi:hypothetical protein [Agrococcus sp. ARC_14]|uniref:hypothetical protein n=1 Tax=Agrococcus sp. ARC_14 TaxID=2919927 RepID=UPI001F06A18A|nr:hypothetical protein [Agrococcus sp. ARC_14]MCH1883751.1 hypothetical protein [Agrococcus sp. ARC_14]